LEAALLGGFRDESVNQNSRGQKIGRSNFIFTSTEQVTQQRAEVKLAKEGKELNKKAGGSFPKS
jgi:hypothetical protein